MEKKVYLLMFQQSGRNYTRRFDCFMDAEDVYLSKCRDARASDVVLKCYRGGREVDIPAYMWSI